MNDTWFGVLFLFLTLVATSCATDPGDEGSSSADIERDCQSFCSLAVPCSEEFAEDWKFETVNECVETCSIITNNGIEMFPSRPCAEITGALWSCAGALPTCEDFAQFEDAAYAKTDGLLGEPCGEEIAMDLMMCN